MKNEDKVILDLCGGTGAWSKPYKENGYDVRLITLPEYDVRYFKPVPNVYGILAAPDCTDLAGSGARWWKEKGEEAYLKALALCDACARVVLLCKSHFWCLENPVGRLPKSWGPPVIRFQPCEYGDTYTKLTCLWGKFNMPEKKLVMPLDGSKIHRIPPSHDRKILRAITPPGFTQAFYEANK